MSDFESLARNFARRDGAGGFPSVGPGAAAKDPQGAYLASVARGRGRAPKTVAYRRVYCNRPDCGGHAPDEERC